MISNCFHPHLFQLLLHPLAIAATAGIAPCDHRTILAQGAEGAVGGAKALDGLRRPRQQQQQQQQQQQEEQEQEQEQEQQQSKSKCNSYVKMINDHWTSLNNSGFGDQWSSLKIEEQSLNAIAMWRRNDVMWHGICLHKTCVNMSGFFCKLLIDILILQFSDWAYFEGLDRWNSLKFALHNISACRLFNQASHPHTNCELDLTWKGIRTEVCIILVGLVNINQTRHIKA